MCASRLATLPRPSVTHGLEHNFRGGILITQRSRILLEKLTFPRVSNSPRFMERKVSLLCSKQASTGLSLSQLKAVHSVIFNSCMIPFNIIVQTAFRSLRHCLPFESSGQSCSKSSDYSHACCISLRHIFRNLIALIISDDERKL
jgi:hypothetical protein